MTEPVLYEKWLGPVWLNKFDRCQSDGQCARIAEHDGLHADVSLSGIVLRVWDEPELSDAEREIIERVNNVRDELLSAIYRAERELDHIAIEAVVKSNPGLAQLVRESVGCSGTDPESMGLGGDETSWGSRIDELKQIASKRRRAA